MSDCQENSPAIEVIHLSKNVPDSGGILPILDDIHFTVQTGESLAIMGASGSGKSTLLGLLAGLDTPTEGTVKLHGTDIFSLNEDERAYIRKEKLGFVFQSFQLLSHLNAFENVMLPLELRQDTNAHQKANAMLKKVGLSDRLKHYPKFLSGGEQQRVALARAFVTRPDILFADEPTGSLDAQTGKTIMDTMFEIHHELKSTLILITHDPTIASRCTRIIEVRAGKVIL